MGDFSINGTQNWDIILDNATQIFKPTYLLAGSRASMIESECCQCFFQEIKMSRYSIWESEYRTLRATSLHAVVDRPVLELHCMLKGGMNYQTEGLGLVQVPSHTFNLCQQPYVVNRVELAQAAQIITFDVHPEPEFLQELCHDYAELDLLMETFLKEQPSLLRPKALPLNKVLNGLLQSVLYAPSCPLLHPVLLDKAIETYLLYSINFLTNTYQKPLTATAFERKAVQDVINYLQTYPEKQDTILELARRFAINSSQLQRLFKAETGLTILEYRTKERMALANVLLREGESVERTAFEVGYSTPSAFIHCFKQKYFQSPLQYWKHG